MSNFSDFKKKFVLELNKEIPQDIVELPSGFGKATIIPMKVKEQKDFLKALEKQDEYLINEAFDKILSRCVVAINGEPFDLENLCIQDRTFLLISIRKLIGTKAKISHVCPVSQKVYNDLEVDLNKMEVEYFKGQALEKTIDVSENIKIKLGTVTRRDEKEIEKWIKSHTKMKEDKSLVDKRYCAYAAVIKEVSFKNSETGKYESEELSFENKVELITDMCTQAIIDDIDEYIKTLDFGIKLYFPFKSEEYENEKEEAMLISFFIM